jgi:hypothetical protein
LLRSANQQVAVLSATRAQRSNLGPEEVLPIEMAAPLRSSQ